MKESCFISRKALFVAFFISLFLSSVVYSQTKDEVFERITSKDGLPQSAVNYIIQDKKGFMWFATYDGLIKYDGYTFKVYRNIVGDKNSLSNNGISVLYEDRDGYIWVINNVNTGLDKFNPITESFTRYKHDPNDSTSLSSNEIFHIMQDKLGNIWVCTKNALNLLVNEKKGDKTFTWFKRFYNAPYSSFTNIYEDSNGRLLLFADYLCYMDRKSYKITRSIKLEDTFKHSVSADKSGNLWLGTHEIGIIKLDYNKQTQNYEYNNLNKINVTPKNKNYLVIDDKERIWIATQSKGLFQYDIKEDRLENFLNDKTDITSISDNNINCLYIDRSGILWIGTYSQGLCKMDLYKKEFFHYKSIEGDMNSLSGNTITSIHSTKPGELWVALDAGGGINRFIFDHDKVQQVIHYKNNPHDSNTIPSNNIFCLVQRKNGEVWTGSMNGFVTKIIPQKPGSNEHPIIKTYKLGPWTFSLYEDKHGTLWGGTWGGGLWRYNDKTDKFISYLNDPVNPTSLCDNVIWTISEDNSGNIWIGGHSGGLSILPAKEKSKLAPEFVNFKNEVDKAKSLSNNTINVIFQDHMGTIWIGTSSGLNRVIIKDNNFKDINSNSKIEFTAYHMKDGLPSENIVGILEDDKDNLWLSTSNGLSKFNSKKNSVTNYYESDGLQSNEFGHNAYFKDQNGRMYFGGSNGISAFYPDSIKPNPFRPKIVFTDIKLFNKSVQIDEKINGDIIISKSINYTSEIILSHKNNVFTLVFAALHYSKPEKNQYAFILEGFEKDWNYVGNKQEATYTNLSPGNYTFRVKASNNDGIWNEKGVSIKLTVLPPWWSTWWFRTIMILLAAFTIWGVFYLRMINYQRQEELLSNQVKQRTLELQEANSLLTEKNEQLDEANNLLTEKNEQLDEANNSKDKFFSIIAHDLKNPFSTILGLSSLLIDKEYQFSQEEQKELIRNIHSSTEKVYDLLENLLMWSRSQLNRIKISPSFYNLTNQIYQVISLLDDSAMVKNVKLIFDEDKEIIIFADMQMIETVIRNLISNAIKFSNENENIKIELLEDDDKEICSIADQGIGMTSEQISNLFNIDKVTTTLGTRGEKGTGLGLSLCLDFLDKNGGTIWVKSAPGKGSTFYFSLPKK